ncbi:MAG: hypothetical protein QM487_07765 [Candidatus Marithrix sp.]
MNNWKQSIWYKLLDLKPDLTIKDNEGLTAKMMAERYAMSSFILDTDAN